MGDRIQPQAIDIERIVLGSMITDSKCLAIAVSNIFDDYFYYTANRLIFISIREMFSKNMNVDANLLCNYMLKKNELEQVGDAPYIADLMDTICTVHNIESYIDILKDKCDRRNGIFKLSNAMNALFADEERSGSDICRQAASDLIGVSKESKSKITRLGEIFPDVFEYVEAVGTGKRTPGDVKTGYPSIDNNVFLKKGFLHILAGRPSMGKTAVVDCWLRNIAIGGNVVLKFNYESSKINDATRNLFSQAKISLHDVNRGILPKRDLPKLSLAAGPLFEANIFIDSFSGNTPTMAYSSCLSVLNVVGKLDVVIFDHLQLIPPDKPIRGNRNIEVGEISRQLMFLAERLNVVVIALSQLSRPQKGVAIKPPVLSDLRESGEIEQNAEVVMFLHREEYYQMPKDIDETTRDRVDFIYAKQKNGPTGCKKMGYKKEWFLLYELEENRDEEPWQNRY